MANPRIEEVSDDDDDSLIDDPEEMDLDSFDFARPQGKYLNPIGTPESSISTAGDLPMSPQALQALLQGQNAGTSGPNIPAGFGEREREQFQREQQEKAKGYQCLYPVYFDSTRSRDDGRRVNKADAVASPLARDLCDALQHVGQTHGVPFQIVFEPTKTHPKDWANPGRVKVALKKDGKPISAKIQNKHHLYKLVASYLKSHPTTTDSPMRFRMQGLPMPKDGKMIPPAIPRGSKIGKILPLHSPALSGGGVSDDFLKDMMEGMGGQLPPGVSPEMMSMLGGGGAAAAGGPTPASKPKIKKVTVRR